MFKKGFAIVLVLVILPNVGYAQQEGAPQFIPARQIADAVTPAAKASAEPLADEVLTDRGHYQYIAVRRTESGVAESHDAWTDITTVREGGGTLVYGGYIAGGTEEEPGEWRGGTIQSGQTKALSAGDVVVIPVGTPHRIVLDEGQTIVYTVVKIRPPTEGEE